MDSAKRRKPNYSEYKSSHGHKSRPSNSIEAGLKGFLCTCNFKEKECVRESYNLLNEYADRFFGGDGTEIKIAEASSAAANEVGDDEDIQSSLNKELETMKADQKKKPEMRKFQVLESGAKNLLFIRTTIPDPVALVHHIVKELEETKKQKTRFLLRLLPIEITCKAYINDIVQSANPIFERYFSAEGKSFAIVFTCRNNKSVSRDKVIEELAKLVTEKNSANHVDLKQPELAVLIEIIRNICCISVLPDYYRFRRYNLLEIAGVEQAEVSVDGDKMGEVEVETCVENTGSGEMIVDMDEDESASLPIP